LGLRFWFVESVDRIISVLWEGKHYLSGQYTNCVTGLNQINKVYQVCWVWITFLCVCEPR